MAGYPSEQFKESQTLSGLDMIGSRAIFAAVAALLCAAAAFPAVAQNLASNPRIALVVGEETYRDQALATTANDAGLIAQTLQAAGFDVVGARDLDGQSLRVALRDFLDKAAAAGPEMQAFVYLAGRGIQYNGDNYFAPIDAEMRRDADVPIEAVRVSDFIHALATLPGRARIVVLDAARANPYAAQGAPLAPGLALVDPEPGVLIAFNAAPGTLAGEEQGPYGVFGKTLAGAMRQGGVDIAEVFDQTRILVNQATEGALLPWSASKLSEPYYVFERAPDAPPPPVLSAAQTARRPIRDFPAEQAYAIALQRDTLEGYREYLAAFPHADQARRVRAILAVRREAAFWRRTLDADTPRAYWTYLRVYRRGPHVADARRRLAILSAALAPPADFAPLAYEDVPPPPPDERFYEEEPVYAFADFGPPPPPPPVYYVYDDDDEWGDLPPPPPPPAVGVLPVLEIAIPLFAGAVAYHGYEHRHDGLAPRGAPRFAPPPPAPPPLPANVRPVRPPPPRPVAAGAAASAIVKPLPPIGPAPHAGGPRPGGKGPAPGPGLAPTTAPPAPAAAAPVAVPPAASPPGKPPVAGGSPSPNAPTLPAGGKPLPAPAEGKPAANMPVAPSGKPAALPPGEVHAPATPPAVAPGGKPLPPPLPTGANPPLNAPAVAPAGKPTTPSSARPLQPPTQPGPVGLPPGTKLPGLEKPGHGAPLPLAPAGHPPAQFTPPAMNAPSAPIAAPPAAKLPAPAILPAGPPGGTRLPEMQNCPPAANPRILAPTAPPSPIPHQPPPAVHVPAQLAPPPQARPLAPPPAPVVHLPPQLAPPPQARPLAPPPAPVVHLPPQIAPPPAARAPVPAFARPPAAPQIPAVGGPRQPGVQPPGTRNPNEAPKPGQPPD